ncbi:MAG TPA: hypothetical protein VKJ47_13720, partial [Candidatus Binatia bacterium]|nr:hypothetical protein [Candidatus Binatia bacterium]
LLTAYGLPAELPPHAMPPLTSHAPLTRVMQTYGMLVSAACQIVGWCLAGDLCGSQRRSGIIIASLLTPARASW